MIELNFKYTVPPSIERLAAGQVFNTSEFWNRLSKHVEKASKVLEANTKRNIYATNAFATGFMRDSARTTVSRDGNSYKILAGTDAFYDVLVHEGLGLHGGKKSLPSKWKPTEQQKAILVPAWDDPNRKSFYKRSPKVPRPFLKNALLQSAPKMMEIIGDGIMSATKDMLRS